LALRKLKIPSSHPPAPARRDAPFTGFCSHSLRSSTYRTKYVSPKTLRAHQLAPVRIGDAHYSSRRGPRSRRPWNEASRRFGVGWVKKGGLFDLPARSTQPLLVDPPYLRPAQLFQRFPTQPFSARNDCVPDQTLAGETPHDEIRHTGEHPIRRRSLRPLDM